jgi:hypothetical protein
MVFFKQALSLNRITKFRNGVFTPVAALALSKSARVSSL